MSDVAALGISIDTTSVASATGALEQMNNEASRTPSSISRITSASDALVAALNRNVVATEALSTRMTAMEAAGTKAATSLDRVDSAARTATTNVVQFTGATEKARDNLNSTAAAADKMAQAWERLGAAGAKVSQSMTPMGQANFRLGNMSSDGSVPMQPGASTGGERNGRLSAFQAQNLFYQGTDIVASAASGMSPLTIALQQGGQIAPTFMGPGGASIGGVFSQVGEGIASLASRVGVLGGAATAGVAAVAALILAQQSYANAQMQITRTLATGAGRLSGATAGDINAVAEAGGGGLSTGTRRDYATQLAGAGVSSSLYGGILGTVKDYAANTGQDQASALSSLGAAFANPAKGAEELNKQLGFLDAATLENIQRLQAQGDKLGAGKMLLDAYGSSLQKASELTSGWSRISEAALTPIANLWDSIGKAADKAFTGGSLDDRIQLAQNVLANSKARESYLPFGIGESDTQKAQQALNDLTKQRAEQEQRSRQAQSNAASIALDNTLKSLNPQSEAIKSLEDKAAAIRRPFMENWVDPNGAAAAALKGLAMQTAQMKEDMAAGGAQYADAIRNAQFGLKTVGYAPEAQSIANINQQQDQKELEARRKAAENTLDGGLDKALASIKQERELLLEAEKQRQNIATSNTPGNYAIGLAQVPGQYRDLVGSSAAAQGISPGLLASLLRRESGFDPNAVSPVGAQGIAQFMPPTARGIGLANPFDPQQAIPKAAELLRQLLKSNGNDEVAALVGYNAGPKVMNRFQAAGNDVSVLPKETRDYIAAIMTPQPGAKANLDAQVQRTRELDVEKQKLDALVAAGDSNSAQYRAQVEKIEQLSAAQARNQTISASGIALIEKEARARQDLQSASQFQSFLSNDNFSRDQLGRSREDQAAYAAARPFQGSSYYDQVVSRTRDTNTLLEAKQMVTDGATSFVTSLRRGASASDALANAFGNAADKLLTKAMDSLVSGAFSMLGGGGAGPGGIGNSIGSLFSFNPFSGFSSGGYTGDGGTYDPAGIVHKGEVVWSQADVARFGGAQVVERMRMGYPGYASGGIVGGGMSPAANNNTTMINVNMQGSSGDKQQDQDHVANTVKAMRDEMNSIYKQNLAQDLRQNGALWKAGVRQSRH